MENTVNSSTGGINASTLKIIAIIGMTMDHIGIIMGDFIPPWLKVVLYAPGGLTFLIMAYLMEEGYRHTKNFKKYALRLFIFALISLLPFMWAMKMFAFNVIFSLFAGLIAIYLYDHMKNRVLYWIVFVLLAAITIFCDWPVIGVIIILCHHTIKNKKRRVITPVIIACVTLVIPMLLQYFLIPGTALIDILPSIAYGLVGCTATIPLLLNYNGERGKPMKYFFYAYYPAHLAILALIRMLIS